MSVGTLDTGGRSASETTLRVAQQRAFERMMAASDKPECPEVVQSAVEELLDACEAYISPK
nr:hypothetical protein [Actinomycetota bacterium]